MSAILRGRISYKWFLKTGMGYGGSCLPKNTLGTSQVNMLLMECSFVKRLVSDVQNTFKLIGMLTSLN